MNKDILTEAEAAIYIGMSTSYLSQDRTNGYRKNRTPGPAYMKFGKSVRYHKNDLDEWLQQRRIVRSMP